MWSLYFSVDVIPMWASKNPVMSLKLHNNYLLVPLLSVKKIWKQIKSAIEILISQQKATFSFFFFPVEFLFCQVSEFDLLWQGLTSTHTSSGWQAGRYGQAGGVGGAGPIPPSRGELDLPCAPKTEHRSDACLRKWHPWPEDQKWVDD